MEPCRCEIVTADVSFISIRLILPALPPLLSADADAVILVKPQFEAGRADVGKGGIVRDEAVHQRVIEEVTGAALALGLTRAGLTESPITGAEGNREYLDAPPSNAVTTPLHAFSQHSEVDAAT